MEFESYSARCGAGKTYKTTRDVAMTTGRYVFAVDRKGVGDEREASIRAFASSYGTSPQVVQIFSPSVDEDKHDNPTWTMSVPREIEAAGEAFASSEHVILIITHAGMKLADLKGFLDWELIIDEVPSVIEHIEGQTGVMREWLRANYQLTPDRDGASIVKYVGHASLKQFGKVGSREWLPFHRLVLSGHTRVQFGDWSDAPDTWPCWRIWEPEALSSFRRVTILGDSFEETETYRLMTYRGAKFKQMVLDDPREWAERQIIIRYFASDHRASAARFKDRGQRDFMARIAEWVSQHSDDNHLFTCNALLTPTFANVPGIVVTPKQAGTNKYSALHTCTMIYSAKPSPDEVAMYKPFGITAEHLIQSREQYDINQFFLRSSARDPNSTAPLEFRVYDRQQAEFVAAYLASNFKLRATLVHEDLGAPKVKRAGRPPTKSQQTDEERKAAQNERQRKSREKKRKLAA